jgi:MFS superfamily sulfate permease-like transporter
MYATRLRTPVDPNQEIVGLGVANLAAAFFQGFPISSSSSRTPVAEAAGAKTQLTGVVGALAIALLLVLAPGLLRDLPDTVLAAVVIASAIGLIEVSDLRRIYRIQRWEFWLSMVCFAGVAVLGAIPGIMLAIVIAVIEFLWDSWRPHSAVLGRVEHMKGYHDVARYPDARLIPGLVLFRWDAPSSQTPSCSTNASWLPLQALQRQFAGSWLLQNVSPASTSPQPMPSVRSTTPCSPPASSYASPRCWIRPRTS